MPARDRLRPFWSKWVWKDWISKTADLSAEARGAHMDLMAYAATNSPDCSTVPNDDRVLAYAARMRLERWRKIRAQVLARWVLSKDGRYYQQSRLAEDYSAWCNRSHYQQERGKEGASRRWRSKKLEKEEKDSRLLPLSDSDTWNGPAAPVPVAARIVLNSSLETDIHPDARAQIEELRSTYGLDDLLRNPK